MSTMQAYRIETKSQWVEPSTQELIQLAKREAARLDAPELLPEHLLYSIILYGDRRVAQMVNRLGLDWQQMYEGAAEIFDGDSNREQEAEHLPLSSDAQECIDWALSFAAEYKHFLVYPEYLLLGMLRHPRIQPVLGLIFRRNDALPIHLTEELGYAYSASMDQLIRSKVRDQVAIPFPSGKADGILTSFSRPTLTFADLSGLEEGKRGLKNMVEFLKSPQMYQYGLRQYNRGAILIGYPSNDRTLLVKAAAGEALVPLVTLSIPVLVTFLQELAAHPTLLDDLDLSEQEQALFMQGEGIQRGRNIIQHIFDEARSFSPCMICVDDIDAIERLDSPIEREQLWNQLLIGIDGAEVNLPLGIIATAQHLDGLEERIAHPGRLELHIVLTGKI
jgi:hypothetical protein